MSERGKRVFRFLLDPERDADVIGRIEARPSMTGYVRELVRRDMHEREMHDERLDFAALKASELQAENAKLRNQLEEQKCFAADLEKDVRALRELVADMHKCISHANEQDWFYFERDKFGCGMSCTVNGETCGLCTLADRMRELGVKL